MEEQHEYYNLAFERSLLSSFLFNPEKIEEFMDSIKPEDMYLPAHQNIFYSMNNLVSKNKPIDEEFIKNDMTRANCFDEMVMLEILTANPISNLEEYIFIIREFSSQRKLLALSTQLKTNADLEDKVELAKKMIDDIENVSSEVDEITGEELLGIEFGNTVSYDTGIPTIENLIGGLEKGQLIYITGAEETGKTHLSYKIMENLSVNHKVGILSLEFGKRKLQERLAGMVQRNQKLDVRNIKASFESHDIKKAEKILKKWSSEGVGFVVIDSINLLENFSNKDSNQNIIDTGRRLFKLTQQLDMLLIVISTSTKEDHRHGLPSIYGGQLLNHYCDQKWHLLRDLETEERLLWVNKNKQNYKYGKEPINFLEDGSITMYKSQVTEYQVDNYEEPLFNT